MSFYGQNANITETHFQFDKIYSSRATMDAECLAGKDGIFSGRFVLIEYDQTNHMSIPNVQNGYRQESNGVVYYTQDMAGQVNFVFTTFSPVGNADPSTFISNYYFKKGDYYFRMPAESGTPYKYYDASEKSNYYVPANTSSSAIVGEGWIIREYVNGIASGDFYVCRGVTNNVIQWTKITISSEEEEIEGVLAEYLLNYNVDKETYGSAFDERGYNGTIWQKLYTGGKGTFIQVARLECTPPKIALAPLPPSTTPAAPHLSANSTDQFYEICVPTTWGLKVARKDIPPSQEGDSGFQYRQADQVLDNGDLADIYLNLGGPNLTDQNNYHIVESNKDLTTVNEVRLTKDGYSGATYGTGQQQPDMMQLHVTLPTVGNMVDQGYDLIYGKHVDDNKRPRDITWYSGDSTDILKQQGLESLGGKTYDLTTLAGNINTMHNVLGQIIIDLESRPSDAAIERMSPKYLYRLNGDLYRRGVLQVAEEIPEYNEDNNSANFTYDPVTVTADTFEINKYFVKISENPDMYGDAGDTYNSAQTYYLKNINSVRYTQVELIQFVCDLENPNNYRNNFYLKEAVDGVSQPNYICDHGETRIGHENTRYPKYLNRQYYTNPVFDPEDGVSFNIGDDYSPGSYYDKEDTGIYSLITDEVPDQNINTLYTFGSNSPMELQDVILYRPGVFYHQLKNSNQNWELAMESVQDSNYRYAIFIFSSTPVWGLDPEGHPIMFYPIVTSREEDAVENGFTFATLPSGVTVDDLYFKDNEKNKFIPYAALGDYLGVQTNEQGVLFSPYVQERSYYILTNVKGHDKDSLYFANRYYKFDDNRSLIIDTNTTHTAGTTYYTIDRISEVKKQFYIPDKYWYKNGNVYERDGGSVMQNTQYYEKASVYVANDEYNQCPRGFEWSDHASYIPPSITLCTFKETPSLIKLTESEENADSLYGLLLKLSVLYNVGDEESRDQKTVRGVYNSLRDKVYLIKDLMPGQILYTNPFGQIQSYNLEANRMLITDADGQISSITIGQLKTKLNAATPE